MKLPAKVIYACKAVTELSLQYNKNGPTPIQIISESQEIPKKFLVHLLIRLKNAGIVNSSRGVSGGYSLARNPVHVSVADVVKAIDDTIITVNNSKRSSEGRYVDKIFGRIWRDINGDILSKLEKISFDTIATELKDEEVTYYI